MNYLANLDVPEEIDEREEDITSLCVPCGLCGSFYFCNIILKEKFQERLHQKDSEQVLRKILCENIRTSGMTPMICFIFSH